jgi:hypothetical protein
VRAAALEARLRESLDASVRPLLDRLGLNAALSVVSVHDGLRAAGRISVAKSRSAEIEAVLRGLSLHPAFCRLEQLEPLSGVQTSGTFVPACDAAAVRLLHFSCSPRLAELTAAAEEIGAHEELGAAFGYPACCVRSFVERSRFSASPLFELADQTGPYPALLNPVVPAAGTTFWYIDHIPCSLDCASTLRIVDGRLQARNLARHTQELEALGSGLALSLPNLGAGLYPRVRRLGGDLFLVEAEAALGVGRLRAALGAPPFQVCALSAHVFEIHERIHAGPEALCCLFGAAPPAEPGP